MYTVMMIPPLRLSSVVEIPGPDARRWKRVYETEAEALEVAIRNNRKVAERAAALAEKQERQAEKLAIRIVTPSTR